MAFEIIDSFERDTLDHYTGDTAEFDISTTRATDGTRSLHAVASADLVITADETSGLAHIPVPGDTLRFDYYHQNGANMDLQLGVTDSSNHIRCEIIPSDSYIYGAVIDGGTFNDLYYANGTTIPADEWLTIEIEWVSEDTVGCSLSDSAGTELMSASGTSSVAWTPPETNAFAWEILVGSTGTEEVWIDAFSGEIDDPSAEQIGTARIEVGTTLYDVPVYTRESVSEWSLSLRATDTDEIGVGRLLDAGEAPLHIRVDGTIYAIESTEIS